MSHERLNALDGNYNAVGVGFVFQSRAYRIMGRAYCVTSHSQLLHPSAQFFLAISSSFDFDTVTSMER
jgi:hypothetical protein